MGLIVNKEILLILKPFLTKWTKNRVCVLKFSKIHFYAKADSFFSNDGGELTELCDIKLDLDELLYIQKLFLSMIPCKIMKFMNEKSPYTKTHRWTFFRYSLLPPYV